MFHVYAVAYDAGTGVDPIWSNVTKDVLGNNSVHFSESITTDNDGHAFIVGA